MTDVIQTATHTGQRLYKSPQPSWKYIFPDGTIGFVIRGEYFTDDPGKIEHLDNEIRKGFQMFYIDPNEKFVSQERLDPLIGLRNRMREELMAELKEEMARAQNPNNNMGTSEQGKLNAQSTRDIAPVTIGGAQLAEQLSKVKVSK